MGRLLTELEVVEAGLDAGGVRASRLHVLSEELARGDSLPFEVLRESLEVLLAARAGSAQQEDASHYKVTVVRLELRRSLSGLAIVTYLGSS